jgi:hypothetical protein
MPATITTLIETRPGILDAEPERIARTPTRAQERQRH